MGVARSSPATGRVSDLGSTVSGECLVPNVIPVPSGVVPVTDYEPPAFGGPPVLPPVAVTRRRPICPAPTVVRPRCADASARDAAQFADAVLRRVLEVIDRRRPPAQLRNFMAAGLVDSLPAARLHGGSGVARLRRVRAFPVGRDGEAAEVAASYTRGERVHAIACRVQRASTPAGPRWQLVALHIG